MVAAWTLLLGMVCDLPAQLRARPLAYDGVDAAGNVMTLPAALRTMAAQAGVIFVGTVSSVRRVGGDGISAAGVVEVTFSVERAVRGVAGGSYLLREWGGLEPPGQRGFAVGERRLMLLHRPSAAGLSSPVGGFEGAIPVVGAGTRVRPTSALSADAVTMLDLRWIAAKLVRPVLYAGATAAPHAVPARSVTGERGGDSVGEPAAEVEVAREPVVVRGTERGGVGLGAKLQPTVTNELPLASVLGMLEEWGELDSRGR